MNGGQKIADVNLDTIPADWTLVQHHYVSCETAGVGPPRDRIAISMNRLKPNLRNAHRRIRWRHP
jgi:hypothetical protein